MAATNYMRLQKIRRLIYSGFTLAEVAENCELKKKEVKASIENAKLSEATKQDLKDLLKRNKRFSKKTLYIDTCGFKGADIKKVLERFPKIVVICEVIDEMEDHQFSKTDEWLGKNIRWFVGAVAHRSIENVEIVSTDNVSDEAYTDNRMLDYLKKLSVEEQNNAIVLTNDNKLSCKLQAYGIEYFGLKEIKQMQERYKKLNRPKVDVSTESNESTDSTESTNSTESKLDEEQQERVRIPNTILAGKTLHVLDEEGTIIFAGNGQIIGSGAGKLIPVWHGNVIVMLKKSKKKLLINTFRVEEPLRCKCGIKLGETASISTSDDIDGLDFPGSVKSKIRLYFKKFVAKA